MPVRRVGRTMFMKDPGDEETLAEALQNLETGESYGTTAPDGNTPGWKYYKLGATAGTTVILYIKNRADGLWYGG